METTKPRTVNSIGMFDMLKGAGMLAIVLGHTAELYPLQLEGGLSLTAFVGFIYRETLMAAFFIASGYGFRTIPPEGWRSRTRTRYSGGPRTASWRQWYSIQH